MLQGLAGSTACKKFMSVRRFFCGHGGTGDDANTKLTTPQLKNVSQKQLGINLGSGHSPAVQQLSAAGQKVSDTGVV
ncbi:hypothetical protein GCM10007394_18660 [Salinibacterium amurskyense]|nr:hypothetical protein GCM10007394_18660 [Salinibacterium amurskyense]